ncbi:hypothetical protein MGYG_04621 [Nannizzia gypsea CBS 118893]|uniref:Uncharacterized protein n=1 Tax=Arthroderma gypseum (strain ATCC MYA-4604 / CBS 118893) TaxID=535722 RepID=E4UU28_ARTGP|nr:hypothetical protein MGYG_04621 [Nannizzia gypsea CBS 118893]EFR01618.1 hypothetical protein MGYG_04621 [Nannizzia gypsea CBS 118893]
MDKMLDNYIQAAFAMFTRGWTAAGLFASSRGGGKVQVILKDPRSSELALKELEYQVLTPLATLSQVGWSYSISNGHLTVSRIIRNVWGKYRHGQVNLLPDLLKVLRLRVTSWARDKKILAAFLYVEPDDLDMAHDSVQPTKDILFRNQ